MRTSLALGTIALSLAVFGEPAGAGSDLLARMAALNPNLHTFTATIRAHVKMKSLPYLAADLSGTYYYKAPDKNKVVFTSGLPLVAQQFDKLYARIESPSQWRQVFAVTVVSDDGATTAFKLVPRKKGNVDHIDAQVDDKTATIRSMRWNYDNGGYAEMDDHYAVIGGNTVVDSQTGHVEEPGYAADMSSTIGGYTFNSPLADSLFAQQ